MKKSTLLMVLSLVLALTIGLGTTLAYLTDTDADVNVMTLGNVDITQNEQQWNEDKTELEEFENDKPLYPYVGTLGWDKKDAENGAYRIFTMENVVDKYVTVTNTGKSDAYVRTIIAAEMGEYETVEEFRNKIVGFSRNVENGDEFKFPGTWVWDDFFVAKIDGHNYMIMVATHQDAVKPEETTIPSLLQIYMNKDCGNEEVEKLDGNGNGKYDVLVLSQAVQTAGFDSAEEALNEAFPMGDAYANVPGWFTGWDEDDIGSPGDEWPNNNPPSDDVTLVRNYEELLAALTEGGEIILMNNITMENTVEIPEGVEVTLDLNGKTINFKRNSEFTPGYPLFYPQTGSKLTFTGNGTVDLEDNFDAALVVPKGEVVIENGTYIKDRVPEGMSPDDVQTMFVGVKSVGASVVIKDGYFDGGYYDTNVENAFVETDADVTNRGKSQDRNAYRTAVKNNVSLLINLSWSSAAGTQDFRIYGGTFVGANPAWGDEGCAMPITPDYLRPWSYYQGMFLEGQQMHDDKIEIPSSYSITEGTTDDGRPTYTVNYEN